MDDSINLTVVCIVAHSFRAAAKAAAVPLAALLLVGTAGPVQAQEAQAHGAIAVGQGFDDRSVAYGVAWNHLSQDEARDAALNACRDSGGTNCVGLAWFRNGCGALVLDQSGEAWGKSGMTQEQAEARAMRSCDTAGGAGCAIVGSGCARPGGEAGTWSGSERVQARPAARPSAPSREEALTHAARVRVQQGLTALGFEAGSADGMFGPRTRSAIVEWQIARGAEATGYLMPEEAEALAEAGAAAPERASAEEVTQGVSESRNQVLNFPVANDTGPTCGEVPSGSPCWIAPAGQPECLVFLPGTPEEDSYNPFFSHRWTGGCDGGTAHGRGALSKNLDGDSDDTYSSDATGELLHGKKQGRWIVRHKSGQIEEGPYVDGKKHGPWIYVDRNGSTEEGSYIEGKRHGPWGGKIDNSRSRYKQRDGSWEGSYVDGERDGRWVTRNPDGHNEEGSYVDGKRHGRWVFHDKGTGSVEEVLFFYGKRQ